MKDIRKLMYYKNGNGEFVKIHDSSEPITYPWYRFDPIKQKFIELTLKEIMNHETRD